jgi:hypothetical protein
VNIDWAYAGQATTVIVIGFVVAYVILVATIVRGARKDAERRQKQQAREWLTPLRPTSGRTNRTTPPINRRTRGKVA